MKISERTYLIIIAFTAACLWAVQIQAQQPDSRPRWEQTEAAGPVTAGNIGSDIGREAGANVRVSDMHIYVDLEQPAQVKLFTILGQPVSQMQLPAGTSRLRVNARGIYILKIGSSTRRVTI